MSKLDALHAEMLGELQEVHQLLAKLHADVPALGASARRESEATVAVIAQACEEFRVQAFALAEFIKQRKVDVLQDLDQASVKHAERTTRALRILRPSLWLACGLAAANLTVTLVHALK